MIRQLLSVLFIWLASQAHAQGCPDFFRFVDFGQIGEDGITYRGGTLLRTESFAGAPMVLAEQTTCVSVSTRAIDGRGNLIPVVTSMSYDPSQTGIALTSLRVVRSTGIAKSVDTNAAIHRERLSHDNVTLARDAAFLCAADVDGDHFSCQLVSPYNNGYDLVVHCNLSECAMPVMAITDLLLVEATWPSLSSTDNELAERGVAVAAKVMQIHDFLADLF